MGRGVGEYPTNQDQIINVGMIGDASSEDARVLGGPVACSPRQILKFEVLKLLEML